VYHSEVRHDDYPPDEIRFSFQPHPETEFSQVDDDEINHIILRSREVGHTIRLKILTTNGTGQRWANGELPSEKMAPKAAALWQEVSDEPLELHSNTWFVNEDFKVMEIPSRNHKAPVVAIFPGFRGLSSMDHMGVVGVGTMSGVFRFVRCDSKGRG
jgi:hypothetical protein